jgi:monoterpene epsilon-lactone hydrolase
MSWQLVALDAWLRVTEKRRLARETDVHRARARMERLAARYAFADRARWSAAPLGRLAAFRRAEPGARATLLWFHGGAYCLGSARTHAGLVGALARRAGVAAVLPEYRLAPEHRFPAAVDDAEAAWTALVAEGVAPAAIVLGGDSAGGGLVFALLHRLAAAGAPMPAAAIAFSPWTDLTLTAPSLVAFARRDAYLPAGRLADVRDQYLGAADARDPAASPWLGSFPGAPPVLIQVGGAEILVDDSRRMAERLRADGVTTTLDLVPGAPHVFQAFAGVLPEADAALDRAAAFIRRYAEGA